MAITIRLKHWQTALTHHGASLLSCIQTQTQTQTPSRSLCSLLSPTNSEEGQKRRQNEEQKEMFRMNYKVDAITRDTRQPFKPSVFFYVCFLFILFQFQALTTVFFFPCNGLVFFFFYIKIESFGLKVCF